MDEADETLALTGESDLPVTPASVVLADDDEMASRVLSIADAEAAESAGEVRFAVTLDGPSAAEVTVGYATADPAGSPDPVAEAGIDYESVSGTLTFAPGEVSRTIRVSVIDDSLDEPDETFALVLSDPRGATLGRGSALGTILDDDEPPTVSIAGASGAEDVGELAFAVALSARSLTGVTVDYASMDGTAVAGGDYGTVEGTLAFAPGETAKTIRVPVIDDALDEADEETFAVALSAPTGATLDAGTATGTIRDDDETPALSVADAAGDEDVGALEFAVTLSAPSGIEVSASYATKDGTATAGGDYEAATGTLVFAPGEVSRTIRVAILDDALHEADEETFDMTLARLVNATAADVSATGTIRDNDLAPPSRRGRPAGGAALRRRCAVRAGSSGLLRRQGTAVLRGLVDAGGGDGRARREPADGRAGIRRRVVGDGDGDQRRGFGQRFDRRARGRGSRRARGGGVGPRVDRPGGPDRRDRIRPRPFRFEKGCWGAKRFDECPAQPGASSSGRGCVWREPVARPADARHPIR